MLTPALTTQKTMLVARDYPREKHPQPHLQLRQQQWHRPQPGLSWVETGSWALSSSESSEDLKSPARLAWATEHMLGSQRLLPWAVTNTAMSEWNKNTGLPLRDKMTNEQTAVFKSKLVGRPNHEQGRIHSHNLKGKITSSYRKKSSLLPLIFLRILI